MKRTYDDAIVEHSKQGMKRMRFDVVMTDGGCLHHDEGCDDDEGIPDYLIGHILSFCNNQKELMFVFTKINRQFCRVILSPSTSGYSLWNNGQSVINEEHRMIDDIPHYHHHTNKQSFDAMSRMRRGGNRTFTCGWYGSDAVREHIADLVFHHRMSSVELCEIELSLEQFIRLISTPCVTSLKLFRLKLKKEYNISLYGVLPRVNTNTTLTSLTVECCNDLPTVLLNHTIGKCQALTSISLMDCSCITNDTICSMNSLHLQSIHLKNLVYVTHDSVCHWVKQLSSLTSIHVENCKKVSEWKLTHAITANARLVDQLTSLSFISQDSGKRLNAGEMTDAKVPVEDVEQLTQLVQQTVGRSVAFKSLKHLTLEMCNEQFTNILLNRVTYGLPNGQLQTLKLSTETQQPTNNQQQQQQHTKASLIQKERYYGLLALKTLDINMSSLHPNLIANLLHLCCSQVTNLSMSNGTFFNRGLLLFTQSARNVNVLSLSDCSFENRQWFNIIVYNLPNLRDLSVKRVHVKQAQQLLPQQEMQMLQPYNQQQTQSTAALPAPNPSQLHSNQRLPTGQQLHTQLQSQQHPPQHQFLQHHTSQMGTGQQQMLQWRDNTKEILEPDRDMSLPRETHINKLKFDTLYALVGVEELNSKSLYDVIEIGALIKHSPQLNHIHVDKLGKWELLLWLSHNLSHIAPTNGLHLSASVKVAKSANDVHDMMYIPRMYMFPPSVHTMNVSIESNGFNAALLLAICSQYVQNKVNIVLSDTCEKELIAMLKYHYAFCMRDDEYASAIDRYKAILFRQIRDRLGELIKHIRGLDDNQRQLLLKQYMSLDFDQLHRLNHMNSLLSGCIDCLTDHEKNNIIEDEPSYTAESVCFLSYDDDDVDDDYYPMSSSSSCSIQ